MMGNSGAIITFKEDRVVKTGGFQNLQQEAYLLQKLGPRVCPHLIEKLENGYVMERCEPCRPQDIKPLLKRIHNLLVEAVWCRQALIPTPTPHFIPYENWKGHNLERVLLYHPWIPIKVADWVYGHSKERCLTHGDPTIANVVFRGDQLLLCDPVFTRPGYTTTKAVDYGKMLQSAAGWEHQLNNEWPIDTQAIEFVLNNLIPESEITASLFWASYHCARISFYNHDNPRGEWTERTSRTFAKML